MTIRKLRIPRLVPVGLRSKAITHVDDGAGKPRPPRRKTDAERLIGEPWRLDGYGTEYRKARQQVIEAQGGRCAITGEQVAVKQAGTWRIVQPGAGVHHKRALSEGGREDIDNLVLLSAVAHARVDADRRRGEG